jgi:hypothetical protein
MKSVAKRASLHEKTVQKVASGELKPIAKKRAPRVEKKPLDKHLKVHPMVWQKAQQILSQPGYTKVEVIDETTVRVR